MALFIEGTACPLCGEPRMGSQRLVFFSPFVANQLDPLWFFSDGVFHAWCFERHPLAERALARSNEQARHARVWPPPCAICGRIITDPDDYFTFGFLTDEAADPLYRYNYLHLHLSCMRDWPDLPRAYQLVEELQRSGTWSGPALGFLLEQMRAVRARR